MSDPGTPDDVSVTDSYNDSGAEKEEVEKEKLHKRADPFRGQVPSTLNPTTEFKASSSTESSEPSWLTKTRPGGLTTRTFTISGSEPNGWWGQRLVIRPWRERNVPERKRTIPPEQEERWLHTRGRVNVALRSTLGYTLDVTHEILDVAEEALRFAPIPGLSEAASVLLTIWDSLQLVETNRLACLRLTERCADILISVREEIYEAGDQVGVELFAPLQKLVSSFKAVHVLLQKQVHRPFIKRYLKRDEILRSISGCDASLSDALGLFSLSIQIRTLKQLQAAEVRRQADHEQLLSSIRDRNRPNNDTDDIGEETPRQGTVGLPVVDEMDVERPTKAQSPTHTATTSSSSQGKASGTTSGPSETIQSPPPTPDSDTSNAPEIPQPPSAYEVQRRIGELVLTQRSADHTRDMDDLRSVMRAALATASDAEMMRVLQVQREEMPEALKTLQRALEVEREKELTDQQQTDEEKEDNEAVQAFSVSSDPAGLARSGPSGLSGLRRRLTLTSQRSKSSRSTATLTTTTRSSGWSGKSERDTLDREFIESGIDALRRLSIGQDINLPSWTITRYEVDLEEKVGMGYFSDVYKARWRNHIVAVKVLAPATVKGLFLHEMSVWKKLQHPNILILLGASSARGDPPWFFVSPFIQNGNLVTYLKVTIPTLSKRDKEKTEKRMVYEIAKGMEYLHRMGVMHGDLKGSNVLIDDDGQCLLADFGQSEMKSELRRISGASPPHGTLRWQAPEVFNGMGSGQLTQQVDVYAFAIVCVEIFTQGGLPWPLVDDDGVRKLVLEENKRPPIPVNATTRDLSEIVEVCWSSEAQKRPSFAAVVNSLKKKGASKYSNVDNTSSTRSNILWEEAESIHKTSPDIRPGSLPDVHDPSPKTSDNTQVSTTPNPPKSNNLNVQTIPMQRVITPGDGEGKGNYPDASPVEYRPIVEMLPEVSSPTSNISARTAPGIPQTVIAVNADKAPSSTTSRSTTTESKTESSASGEVTDPLVPGLEIPRLESPPPADEVIAQRKNESRYRLRLQHEFHPSLVLPLWTPTPVKLGAVGYLARQTGTFVTLFNSFNSLEPPEGKAKGIPSLFGYGKLQQSTQRQDRRNVAQRGYDIIQGLLWFRSRKDGDYQRSVSRRYSYPLRAGHKSAYLCAETTVYKYVDNVITPKAWFVANIDTILEIYGKEHRLQKEDVLLVIGTLDAENYGLFVNHNNPDGQVHFNVFSPVKNGQPWGVFATDTDLPATMTGGPVYNEDVPGQHSSAIKISTVSPGPWNTVLLARLRFKPDGDKPTSL